MSTVTVRQATEVERKVIMGESFNFCGSIPVQFHLTKEQVYDLCGIDWRKIKEEDEKENLFWREFVYESMRRILERDGEL